MKSMKEILMSKEVVIGVISVAFSPIVKLFEQYLFADWEFVKYLIVLIVIDTITEFYINIKAHTINSKAFGNVVDKLIAYSSLLIIVHIISHFTVEGKAVEIFHWMQTVAYSALLVRESISILENISIVNSKLIPSWILKRLKEFDKTGKLEQPNTDKP